MPFLAPAIGAAGGIVSGVATWLGGNTILAGVAKMGLGMAAKYAIGTALQPKVAAQTVKLETSYGEDRPREVVLGKVGTAGQQVFRNTNGTGNKRVLDVYKLSDFRITGVTRVRNEGEWTTLGADNGTGDDYRGKQVSNSDADFYIHVYDGTQTVADPVLVNSANPAGRWTSSHKGIGIAYAVADQELHREKMREVWDPFFEVVGPALYDWRKDSSVGGSGSDRWNDQSSWSGSIDNPALMMYALERGIFIGTEMIVGKGVSASRLPLAEWTIAANICDENVSGKKRYTAGIIAAAGMGVTHDQNMQGLLEACAATWVEDASGEYPIVGAAQSPLVTFTDDDIVPDEPFRFSRYRTRSELVNTVSGTWRDPEKFYEAVPFKTKIDASALAEDGERLAVPLPFGAVNVVDVADRLADIAFRASRYQANADICLPPRFLDKIKPGRWVRWNSARYGDRRYQVLEKRLGPFGAKNARNVYPKLQEVGNGIFDPTEFVTVPTVPAPPGEPVYDTEAGSFNAFAIGVSIGGETIPGLKFTWAAFADVTVVGVEVEYRPVGQADSIIKRADVPVQVIVTTDGVLANTTYEYRHRLVTLPVRATFWTGWSQVTTSGSVLPAASVFLGSLAPDAYAALQAAHQAVNDAVDRLTRLAANVAEGMGVQASDMAALLRYQGVTAGALRSQQVRIDAQDGKISAFAEILDLVNVAIGGTSASSLLRLTAEAGSGDVVARGVFQARATVDAAWVNAGIIIEAGFTGGDPTKPFARILNSATQHYWTGANGENPTIWGALIDGVWYLRELMVDRARIPLGELEAWVRPVSGQYYTANNPPSDSVYFSTAHAAWSINNESGNPVTWFLDGFLYVARSGTVSGTTNLVSSFVSIRNVTTGWVSTPSIYETTGSINVRYNLTLFEDEPKPAIGNNDYELVQATYERGTHTGMLFQFNEATVAGRWGRR